MTTTLNIKIKLPDAAGGGSVDDNFPSSVIGFVRIRKVSNNALIQQDNDIPFLLGNAASGFTEFDASLVLPTLDAESHQVSVQLFGYLKEKATFSGGAGSRNVELTFIRPNPNNDYVLDIGDFSMIGPHYNETVSYGD